MAFYLRKALSSGPVRFNLSKSGLGLSVGVKGFRVGAGPGKKPYVHAGRYGLYYRKSLSGTNTDLGGGRGATPPKVERMVAAEVFKDQQVHDAERGVFVGKPELSRGWLLLLPVYIVLWAMHKSREGKAESYVRELMEFAGTLETLDEETAARADELRKKYELPEVWYGWAHETVYENALSAVLEDLIVDENEVIWLSILEVILGIPEFRTRELKTDWFRAIYMDAVSDRVLTDEEETQLKSVMEGLSITPEEVEPELDTIRRLKQVRDIERGKLMPIEPYTPVQNNETCYLEAPGRVLARRVIDRFQREGVKYKNTGLLTQREGTLVITDKRLLVVGDGATTVRLNKILDIEVEPDLNLLAITKDGRKTPIYISTPESLMAGALIDRLVREGPT